MATKILIAEDESKIRKVVRAYLEKEDFEVLEAEDGAKAIKIFEDNELSLIILDLMLPKISGEDVCQYIRQTSDLPILMLTARSSKEDRIQGFNYGADDYLVKPFSPKELILRIKAILRRTKKSTLNNEVLIFEDGRIKVYPNQYQVKVNNEIVDLTSTEFKLLLELIYNVNQVLSREQLALKVMGLEYSGFDRTIDAHIKNIRKKLNLDKNEFIITVYGAGYKFVGDQE